MRIFIDVKTPGNGKNYEFRLDSMTTVARAKEKMIDDITEIENGNITLNLEKVALYNLTTHSNLQEELTLSAAGVKSGQSLMLL